MKIKLIDRYAARLIADAEMNMLQKIPFYCDSKDGTDVSDILFFCALQEDEDTFREMFIHIVKHTAFKNFSEGCMEGDIEDLKIMMNKKLEKGEEK